MVQVPRLVSVEVLVLSLAWCSGLRIPGVGHSSGSDSVPDPGTSICCRCSHKRKKKNRVQVLYTDSGISSLGCSEDGRELWGFSEENVRGRFNYDVLKKVDTSHL